MPNDKNIEHYSEELAPESSPYHIVSNGNLYLTNFGVGQSDLLPQHKSIIDIRVVPFIQRAIKRLGPGKYSLGIVGSASATGSWSANMHLSDARADKAGAYAVKSFQALQKVDSALAGSTLIHVPSSVGDEKSKEEASLLKINGSARTEKLQPHFRAAMFRFKAGLAHPTGAATYQIREVFKFSFEPRQEPLPEALLRFKTLMDHPLTKFATGFLKDATIKKFLALASEAVPFLGPFLSHSVSFMVPKAAVYCVDIRDYRGLTARYRFDGLEHKDSWGIMELIGGFAGLQNTIGKFIKVVKQINDAKGKADKVLSALASAVKAFDQLPSLIRGFLRSRGVPDRWIDTLVNLVNGVTAEWDALTVEASDWANFRFHDGSPKHRVHELMGPARRVCTDAAFWSVTDLDFGGYVENNWKDYNAVAHIPGPARWANSVFGFSTSKNGKLTLG